MCGKSTVTIYSPNKPHKVYCPPCWWSDKWDASEYGQEFDFSRPFFEQFRELQLKVPRIALLTKNSVNSEYTNHSSDNKNCYLCFAVFFGENNLYCTNMFPEPTRDCVECYYITGGGELLYECIDTRQSYSCQFGYLLRSCNDCIYCFDCRGCSHCLFSYNLRNKQYYIFNKPYSKDAYHAELKKMKMGSYEMRVKYYGQWRDLMKARALHRFAIIENSNNVSGNQITNSRNTHRAFDANNVEDAKYIILSSGAKTVMDSSYFGTTSELVYESHGMFRGSNIRFTHLCYDNADLEYCDMCYNSERLFGCIGVKRGDRMIFNKKYSNSEYTTLREKIISHMKSAGEYGEFFPPYISPVSYNETQGQVYMPLEKEGVQERGWLWEDSTPGTLGKETLPPDKVPDDILDVAESILGEVLKCVKCTRNYNIVEPELRFYRWLSIPVPRLCPDCRYRQKIATRTPRKLWHRQCMCDYKAYKNTAKHQRHPEGRCLNEFETSFAPERQEIVYCEQCYNAEVA